MEKKAIKDMVRQKYASVVKKQGSCCASDAYPCNGTAVAETVSSKIGYTNEDLRSVPKESNLGLGCGNPVAFASLKEGEVVLDLGSGAGIDCFLASDRVGESGKVIGVDMTPEMIEKARENALKNNYKNVEFRLGEIENLPVENSSVDAVISNCVINLSPDKERVFREIYRALKQGGRLMVSDIVLLKGLPDGIKDSVAAYTGCIAGAMLKEEYIGAIEAAGFQGIKIIEENGFLSEFAESDPVVKSIVTEFKMTPEALKEAAASVVSIKIHGTKPGLIYKPIKSN